MFESLRARDYQASPVLQELRSVLGGLQTSAFIQAMIARGFGWNVTVGSLSTGITGGGAGTVLDLDQPEFGISVPAGYTMVPFDVRIQTLLGLQTTDSHVSEILLAVDRTAAWVGDGTVVAETPLNLRTNLAGACPLPAFSAATADITDPVLSFELARKEALTDVQGTAATVNVYQFDLNYQPDYPPFLVGPCGMYGYWGGNIAVVGFAQINFLAFPTTLISALQ